MKQPLFSIFKPHPVITVFSEKTDGPMKVTGSPLDKHNRIEFLKSLKISPHDVVSAWLAHGGNVRAFYKKDAPAIIKGIDGLITQDDIFLSITAGDCLPIYMYDTKTTTAGLVHAGWRGIKLEVLPNAIQEMKKLFSGKPENILIGIGPAIGVCHYSITEERAKEVPKDLHDTLVRKDNALFWNLKEAARKQALREGIREEHIEIHPSCTFCDKDTYFSYRREKPETYDDMRVMMAVIGKTSAL